MLFDPMCPHELLKLPPNINFKDSRLLDLVIKARAELGELKGYSFSLPNQLLLLSPAIVKESLVSSEIENINTTMIDVLQNQLFSENERSQPDKEVLRYRDAVLVGFEGLSQSSLSTRLILKVQTKLVPGSPDYRRNQNGLQNSVKKKIVYTPPTIVKIPELMSNLENFMNDDGEQMDPLLRTAIAHYQFEAIHPLSDGNGRTGRILMVLQLVQAKILDLPILYISGYINEHKNDYYRLLLEVTTEAKWMEYIEFMLNGFYLQARETKILIRKIMDLFFEIKDEIKRGYKSIYSADLTEALFCFPVITPTQLSRKMGVGRDTASRNLKKLARGGLLAEVMMGKYHLFSNKRLLQILHGW